MVDFVSVKNGEISLADIVGLNHYLDMKSDIEYAAIKKAEKRGKRGNG